MDANESFYYQYPHPHHRHPNTPSTTATTTPTTTNGMFTNTQTHQNQNHNIHVSSPHYSSSEPNVFSPHSLTAASRGGGGVLPSSSTTPPPPPPETVKRKRGRPRKYGTPDGPSPSSSSPRKKDPSSGSSSLSSLSKKSQLVALGNAGQGFTPHIITVAAGEDVAQKILSFVQQRKFAVCILSASGSISNPSLRQPAMLGGNMTYEGRFEILSLSGSYLHSETGGASSRTGGLSVCLSGTDGRIIGGGVGGPLRAAGPVQVIAGSFFFDATKNATADTKPEASLDMSAPQIPGASITSVTFRNAPDSFGGFPVREMDDNQNIGGNNFILQHQGTYVTSPHLTDWRGGLDIRSNIEFGGRRGHEEYDSPDDGDD